MKTSNGLLSEPKLYLAIACLAGYLILAHVTGRFDPLPEPAEDRGTVFLYYGPDGETRPAGDGFVGYSAAEAAL